MHNVYAIENFIKLKDSVIIKEDINDIQHLKDIPVPSKASEVSLLIGQDVPDALKPLEVRDGGDHQPYAVRTALGWVVNGPMHAVSSDANAVCNFVQAFQGSDYLLDVQVEKFWKLDTGHMLADKEPAMSEEDKKVIKIWDGSARVEESHYVLDIPFKDLQPQLPNNRSIAEKRLQNLGRRLIRDEDLRKKYTGGIKDLIEKNYAELVPEEQEDGPVGMTWYLPHHNVVNPNKPDKVRIVFDCAAEYKGTSLNKNILQGPDLTSKLIGVLLRFREHKVAVMGDIEAMFHQVHVAQRHRDVLRFLWWKDGIVGGDIVTYRMNVHLLGGVWSPSCATYALQRTAKDNEDNFSHQACDTVKKNFYVDDCLKSVPNVLKLRILFPKSTSCFPVVDLD